MNGMCVTLQLTSALRKYVAPACNISVRCASFKSKGKDPEIARNYQQRLADVFNSDDGVEPVNIGISYQPTKYSRAERMEQQLTNRRNRDLEKLARLRQLKIPLDEVKADWKKESGCMHVRSVAEHYGIYRDLFDDAYFVPNVWMNIAFELDEEYVMPVHHGNRIPPSEASKTPLIEFEADPDSMWTLLMTNPDGHLTDNNSEYLHWLIGNIPGGDVDQGEVLCDYLQPFPPRGTGFHRHIFILFKQEGKLDLSSEKKPNDSCHLSDRTFSTLEFYRKHQDVLTPMGLQFFQAEWDESVQDIFHEKLGMKEPTFEYKHADPYLAPQKRYPHKEPFNVYLDRYRDKKDLAEEAFRKYFKDVSPFGDRPESFKYPLVHRAQEYSPTWLKWDEAKFHLRRGKYKNLPK